MVEWFRLEWRVPDRLPAHAMFELVHRKGQVIRSAQRAYSKWQRNESIRNNPYHHIWMNRIER